MPAGYSRRSLAEKLGLKAGQRVWFGRAPESYFNDLGTMPDVKLSSKLSAKGDTDFLHYFTVSRTEFENQLPSLRKAMTQAGMLWVSWPKKASGVATDLTEDVIRNIAIKNDLVDVKVCAVDEIWSGLKLVIPVAKRK